MERLLVCGIVLLAAAAAARRLARRLRQPEPGCCGCDSCPAPEADRVHCEAAAKTRETGASNKE